MVTVISRDSVEKHHVDRYNFKVISLGESSAKEQNPKEQTQAEDKENGAIGEVDSSALSTSSKDSLIESLMKKTDEMSSNFIKLQMKLEAKEEEFAANLKAAKEQAFAEGREAGKAEAKKEIEEEINNSLKLYAQSIQKLDTSAQEFKTSLESLKSELIDAALNIAQEVIKVELSENSQEVAKVLSDELIKDLQTASKITLKVNPKDFTYLSEQYAKLENVSVIADSAVSEGGVIVVSDAGNIDAQISKRFQRVKKAALSE